MDTFNYKNLSVQVTVDYDTRKLEYEDQDGIIIRYVIDRFVPDLVNKRIHVGFVRSMIGKVTGQILKTKRDEYIEMNYLPFYHVVPPISVGEFSSKSIMNGLIRRLPEFGGDGMRGTPGNTVIYAMPSGDFFQPVVLNDAAVVKASEEGAADGEISVSVANGVAPYQYQLDGNTPQASADFAGLAPSTYTIRVTDDEGNWAEQEVIVGVTEAVE